MIFGTQYSGQHHFVYMNKLEMYTDEWILCIILFKPLSRCYLACFIALLEFIICYYMWSVQRPGHCCYWFLSPWRSPQLLSRDSHSYSSSTHTKWKVFLMEKLDLQRYCMYCWEQQLFWLKALESMISGSLSPQHGACSGCGWRNGLHVWRVAVNILNKQSRTADKGWSSSLGVGWGDNNSS